MKIYKEKFKTDQKNRLYWGRVYFISDDRGAKTKLLWTMSFEWVRRQLLCETWKDSDVDHLLNVKIVNKIKEEKRKIFSFPIKFAMHGIDQEENSKLSQYLQERDRIDRHG